MIRKHLVGVMLAVLATTAMAQEDTALYTVVEGNKVDAKTFKGWDIWRKRGCTACHGTNQEGAVGPSLIDALKVLGKEDFTKTVLDGRNDFKMPPHKDLKGEKIEALYAYLKGRSDGKIAPGKVFPME